MSAEQEQQEFADVAEDLTANSNVGALLILLGFVGSD
jgi:hypothetical protein